MSGPKQRIIHPLGACAAAFVLVSTLVQIAEPSASAATGGKQVWVSRHQGSVGLTTLVAASADGSKVFVTGTSADSTIDYHYATLADDASTGSTLWTKSYYGPLNSDGYADSIATSPDGSRVFVTGMSFRSATGADYATVAYEGDTGSVLWVRRYNGPQNSGDYATAVTVSPDGSRVFVTGASAGRTNNSNDYATIAYEASSGKTLWIRRYNGPANDDDEASSVRVNPGGSEVFVTGFSASATSRGGFDIFGYATVAYSVLTGQKLWVRRYGRLGLYGQVTSNASPSLEVSPDGSKVFLTGDVRGDYGTIAYQTSTGTRLWVERYNGPGDGNDIPSSVAVSPDGSEVVVTGRSLGMGTGTDYATIAYDASTGATLWLERYNGPLAYGADHASSLVASPDGSEVFVTGWSYGMGTGFDYATVAYEASTGSEQWVARYNGPGNLGDRATSVAVSPDGSEVFVTGTSAGPTTGRDYATVAYAA